MPKKMKKRTVRKKTTDAKQTKAITILKKKVKQLEAPIETKYMYRSYDTTDLSTQVQYYLINDINPWNTDIANSNKNRLNTREGAKITMKKYMLRAVLSIPYNTASVTRQSRVRVRFLYVYYPDQPGGSNIDDILDSSIPGVKHVNRFFKRNGTLKYKILKDKIYSMEPQYYNFTNTPATPVTNQHAGFTSTYHSFHTIRHSLDLSKLPNNGECSYGQALTGQPNLGRIVLYTMSDNSYMDCQIHGVDQITWLDQ